MRNDEISCTNKSKYNKPKITYMIDVSDMESENYKLRKRKGILSQKL